MRRFNSVILEQLDERLGTCEIAEDPHRRVGRALAQRGRERDLIAFAARGIRRQVTHVHGDVLVVVLPEYPPKVGAIWCFLRCIELRVKTGPKRTQAAAADSTTTSAVVPCTAICD